MFTGGFRPIAKVENEKRIWLFQLVSQLCAIIAPFLKRTVGIAALPRENLFFNSDHCNEKNSKFVREHNAVGSRQRKLSNKSYQGWRSWHIHASWAITKWRFELILVSLFISIRRWIALFFTTLLVSWWPWVFGRCLDLSDHFRLRFMPTDFIYSWYNVLCDLQPTPRRYRKFSHKNDLGFLTSAKTGKSFTNCDPNKA